MPIIRSLAQENDSRSVLAPERSAKKAWPGTKATFSVSTERASNLDAGPIQQTGRDLDIALQGKGWFAVQDAQGGEAYSRRGDLQVQADGRVLNGAGQPVLGERVQRLADRIQEPFGLATSPHPARLPDIAINLFWHAKFNRDPGSLWLRQLLVALFSDASARPRKADSGAT